MLKAYKDACTAEGFAIVFDKYSLETTRWRNRHGNEAAGQPVIDRCWREGLLSPTKSLFSHGWFFRAATIL